MSPAKQMRFGTREQLRRAGFGPRALAQLEELRAAYEDYLRGELSRNEIEPVIRAAAAWS